MDSTVNGEGSPILGTAGWACKQLPASLSTIPDEIIEQIAENLRDNIIDDESYAECYLSDNCSDFSTTRFDLSSFSKVCAHVRWPAERALYQDIHVHFTGWGGINSAHPEWRGGSLRLLLRTLEGRIDLRGCVRSVQMDWNYEMHDTDSEKVQSTHALRQFFARCTSVRRLNVFDFPSGIIAPLPHITTVATSVPSLHMSRAVVKTFPVLEDLYLVIKGRIDKLPSVYAFHQLKKLHIESTEIDVHVVFWALEVCAHITEELHMNCSGYYQGRRRRSPALIPLSPSAGTNLRTLRLVGEELNFLAHPNGSLAQTIQKLPSLQHLHLSRCLSFHASAFSVLPASLRCLFLSQYGEWVNGKRSRHVFVAALSKCLAQALRVVEMVTIHGLTKKALDASVMGDLGPLKSVCNDRKIPFHVNTDSDNNWLSGEIRILFA